MSGVLSCDLSPNTMLLPSSQLDNSATGTGFNLFLCGAVYRDGYFKHIYNHILNNSFSMFNPQVIKWQGKYFYSVMSYFCSWIWWRLSLWFGFLHHSIFCFLLLLFLVFQRYHVLQESLIKLVEACNDQTYNMDRWLSKLEASNWLTHIKEILTTACLAAQCIDR